MGELDEVGHVRAMVVWCCRLVFVDFYYDWFLKISMWSLFLRVMIVCLVFGCLF